MAQITFPSGAVLEALALKPSWPGRISHAVPATDDEVIVDRGTPRWTGQAKLAQLEAGSAEARAVESLLARLSQHENFTELPLGVRASAFSSTTISSVASGTITLAAIPSGMAVDTFMRSGNRLFIITSLVASTRQITVWPEHILAASATVEQAATIRVRLAGKATDTDTAGGFAGPWTLPIREAI